MRKNLFAATALLALIGSLAIPLAAANAQLNIEIATVDPLTKLSADKWLQLATRIVNPSPLVGKDAIYMVNATGEDLNSVTCKGYFLVGPKPYITSNKTTNAPISLPKWTVTLVPTESFDTYCKAGVDANGSFGNYHGTLNSADHTFGAATFVVFNKAN